MSTAIRPTRPLPLSNEIAYKPDHIEGFFVGINITFDGWLVMTTDHGWVVLLKATSASTGRSRSGAARRCGPLRGESQDYGHTGFGWVRTSVSTTTTHLPVLVRPPPQGGLGWRTAEHRRSRWRSEPVPQRRPERQRHHPVADGLGLTRITSSCSATATRSSTSPMPGARRSPTTGSSYPMRRRAASLASVPPTWATPICRPSKRSSRSR